MVPDTGPFGTLERTWRTRRRRLGSQPSPTLAPPIVVIQLVHYFLMDFYAKDFYAKLAFCQYCEYRQYTVDTYQYQTVHTLLVHHQLTEILKILVNLSVNTC